MSKVIVKSASRLLREGFDKEALIAGFVAVNKAAWPPPVPERYLWTREKVISQLQHCPEYLFCAIEDTKVVGTVSGIGIKEKDALATIDWEKTSANGTLTTHQKDGDCVFGLDLSVTPDAQGKKIGDNLIQTAFLFSVIFRNKKGVFLGSRAPSYHKWANKMSIEDYVFGKNGKTRDPEIRLYQTEGFQIVKIVPNYMEDPDSLNYGVLMFYPNPVYKYTRWMPDWMLRCAGKIAEKFL